MSERRDTVASFPPRSRTGRSLRQPGWTQVRRSVTGLWVTPRTATGVRGPRTCARRVHSARAARARTSTATVTRHFRPGSLTTRPLFGPRARAGTNGTPQLRCRLRTMPTRAGMSGTSATDWARTGGVRSSLDGSLPGSFLLAIRPLLVEFALHLRAHALLFRLVDRGRRGLGCALPGVGREPLIMTRL